MAPMKRNPGTAATKRYDVIVIGGGIYGAMLIYEGARRGFSCLLLEKDDFGEHTSFNNLRIVHGGLRYLQTLDIHRFRESQRERTWFLKHFPHLVKPLPCLMPLYGKGLRRPSVMRIALSLNDRLSGERNRGIEKDRQIPDGKVIGAEATAKLFPAVDRRNLRGAALWYDAYMPDSPRIVIDLLRAAVGMGADVINYLEATSICVAKNKVTGVEGVDMTAGRGFRFEAPVVVNTAGPWARKLAAQFDADYPELFQPSLAWNVLLNRPALSAHALALAPKKPKARTYFILPYKGKMLAGTDHGPWLAEPHANPMPDVETIRNFLNDLNLTIPGLNLTADDIMYIFSGLLPAKENGTQKLAVREIILDHSTQGGPWGLVSVSGVKFTTARLVAEKTLAAIEARRFHGDASVVTKALGSNQVVTTPSPRTQGLSKKNKNFWKEVQEIITEEAVMHLDDLVCRRTSLWEDKGNFSGLVEGLSKITGWDALRQQSEIARLEKWCQNRAYPGPESPMPSTKVSRQNVVGSSQEAV